MCTHYAILFLLSSYIIGNSFEESAFLKNIYVSLQQVYKIQAM